MGGILRREPLYLSIEPNVDFMIVSIAVNRKRNGEAFCILIALKIFKDGKFQCAIQLSAPDLVYSNIFHSIMKLTDCMAKSLPVNLYV